ncbi:hypothetical protein F4778DRAFT_732670 [Xylariomycetidae sp. FL2044]|nr:hypothetical protein F4778DRAFT_732670 [Xylariomycetidae sp. FL2044]
MALLQMPVELLLEIAELSLPYGFESLSLTCKHIHHATSSLLARHNWRRCHFRRFTYGFGNHDELIGKISTGPDLLLFIARDPIIAEYIVELDMAYRGHIDDVNKVDESEVARSTIRCSEPLRRLVAACRPLQCAGLSVSKYIEGVAEDKSPYDVERRDYTTVFLLTLLPNLKILTLPECWNGETVAPNEPTGALLRSLIRCANIEGSGYLSCLEEIDTAWGDSEQNSLDLAAAAPFAGLKTLRKLRFASGGDQPSWAGIWASCHLPPSNLECLELPGATFDGNYARTLFSTLPKLKRLKLQYISKDEEGLDWDADGFVQALASSAAGRSIERLSLTLGCHYGDYFGPVRSTFHDMENLVEVELDTRLFHNVDDICGSLDGGDNYNYDDVPRLLDILPSGVRQVQILTYTTHEDTKTLGDLFEGLYSKDERSYHLPSLEKVIITRNLQRFDRTVDEAIDISDEPESVQLALKQLFVELRSIRPEWY